MQGTRLIVSACGCVTSAGEVSAHLKECGAHVLHTFSLIPGVSAGLSPDALRDFLSKYPTAQVIPDRRRSLPPMPLNADDLAEVSAPKGTVSGSPTSPQVSPLALSLMKVDEVQAMGIDGSGVRVCVIDSGIDFTHPDLQFTAAVGPDGNPLAVDFTETDLTDTLGHGTAVAGCIAAQARQVFEIVDEQSGKTTAYTRIKGVAPGVKLMSAKVFDARVPSGYDSAIIAALEWAAENGAQIINMSLGGVALPNDGSDPLAEAVTALRKRGVLVLVAAGNAGGGVGTLESPGAAPGALTVGASTSYRSFAELGFLAEPGKWTADQLASFSSAGPAADGRVKPDIVAPGAFDWGLAPTYESEEGQGYQLFGGTSQATPLMAGCAALVYQAFHKARNRYPTPDEAVQYLCSNADDLGFLPNMQGAGRVNVLRAVQSIFATDGGTILAGALPPLTAYAGSEVSAELELSNPWKADLTVPVKAYQFQPMAGHERTYTGTVTTAQSPVEFSFNAPEGIDLMQVSLNWQTEDHTPHSPRLMVAVYDPQGRFVNYQRPNSSGDLELGKSVDTWIARPQAGTWRVRVVLRLGTRDTSQEYNLTIRPFKRAAWDWVTVPDTALAVPAGQTTKVPISLRIPEGVPAGTYMGYIQAGFVLVPLSAVVPIRLEKGEGVFAGAFQHGYQGSWGNGDWFYHQLPVPAGTKSLIASIQWPDVDNALECYLVDPTGKAVLGRSNNDDILDDGDTDVLGGQLMLANPEPGNWLVALHSFAFCGRGIPEPYSGVVETGGELVSPRTVLMNVEPKGQAPISLLVKNPGRMPITVAAQAQSTESCLTWRNVTGELRAGVRPDGSVEGEAHLALAMVDVPHGARQIGVVLTWEPAEVELSLSLFDPVAQSDRATVSGKGGQLVVMESNPVPGQWTVMAGMETPTVETQVVRMRGATFMVAPRAIDGVVTEPVVVQPGNAGLLPLTIPVPEQAQEMAGRIMVTTTAGDRLGEVAFRIQVEEAAAPDAEVATTKG